MLLVTLAKDSSSLPGVVHVHGYVHFGMVFHNRKKNVTLFREPPVR
jgi:hypothetical protein